MYYDYEAVIKEDIIDTLAGGIVTKDNFDEVREMLEQEDGVTGNMSGSYFCNTMKAREALLGNEDLYYDCASEYYDDYELAHIFYFEPEKADCIIRFSLVSQILTELVTEENENEGV